VDEAEWLACTDPTPMLEFLLGKASDRKLRLFTCAYARRVWGLLKARRQVRPFEIAERYVDGEGSFDDLTAAFEAVIRWGWDRPSPSALMAACTAPLLHPRGEEEGELPPRLSVHGMRGSGLNCTLRAIKPVAMQLWRGPDGRRFRGLDFPDSAAVNAAIGPLRAAEVRAQADLLRDIFGLLPFRDVAVRPDVLAWNDRVVPRIAQAIYDERRFGDMPILADALLDAGCDDEALIAHCRSAGPHVRGCWAVDRILGKS
jgi:hypothetical protein